MFFAGMKGEARRRTTAHRHDVDVGVAVVLRGERDHRAIAVENGMRLLAVAARQSMRGNRGVVALRDAARPEVTLTGEDDLIAVQRGLAIPPCLRAERRSERETGEHGARRQGRNGAWMEASWTIGTVASSARRALIVESDRATSKCALRMRAAIPRQNDNGTPQGRAVVRHRQNVVAISAGPGVPGAPRDSAGRLGRRDHHRRPSTRAGPRRGR